MAINIPESIPSDFPELPIGSYQAVISALWDIGIQKSDYQGEIKFKHQMIIQYEINKLIPEGKYEGDRYTINAWTSIPKSFDDRSIFIKLRNSAEQFVSTASDYIDYDEQKLIGKNIILNISHNKNQKAAIESFGPLMEGMALMETKLKSSVEETPVWVQKQAAKAVDPQENGQPPAPEDDLPF